MVKAELEINIRKPWGGKIDFLWLLLFLEARLIQAEWSVWQMISSFLTIHQKNFSLIISETKWIVIQFSHFLQKCTLQEQLLKYDSILTSSLRVSKCKTWSLMVSRLSLNWVLRSDNLRCKSSSLFTDDSNSEVNLCHIKKISFI